MTRQKSARPFFAPPRPRIIAHRGLATTAPENTAAAFRAALEAGATHLETDVQGTRDGHSVILHDPDLRRVLGDPAASALASALTLDELRALAGERLEIATLPEILAALPDALFNIDVKSTSAIDPTAEAIRQARAEDRVLITSFSGRRRRATLRRLSTVATSASAPALLGALLALKVGALPIARRILASVDAVQLPERVLRMRTTTPRMITRWHAAGVEVHVWTINARVDMTRLLDADVDGIVTDRCDVLTGIVASRERR